MSPMPTPIWLLDVDGVINCTSGGWHGSPWQARVADSRGRDWKVRWAPQLVREIRRIHADGLAEIRWCSTWCEGDSVRTLERLWNMPHLPSAFRTPPTQLEVWDGLKHAVAMRTLAEENRPVIWTDDLAPPRTSRGARWLTIKPKSATGLRPHHIVAIRMFCQEMRDV